MKYDPKGDLEFQLDKLLNEGLEFSDNFRGALLEVDLAAGENTVIHSLGFVPQGYLVLYSANEAIIYGSRVEEWTSESIFLVSNVTSPAARLFVM
jgi:hypothetical protein